MNQQERFDAYYADQHGVPVESMTAYRLADTYRLPGIAAHYRTFKAAETGLLKDAERYRWLRDRSESIHQFYLSTPIWFTGVKFSKENVDSTIDAAMTIGSTDKDVPGPA